MCKKLLFLMTFLVLMAAGTQAYAGILLKSNWDHALGASDDAITDGGIWSGRHVEAQNGARLEVFPPDHACLEGHNYLAAWIDNHNWAAVYNWDVWPNDAEDIYIRFYCRVKPHGVAPDYISFTNGHFVQSYQLIGPTGIGSRSNWWGIRNANATVWELYGPGLTHTYYYDYPYNMFKLPGLPVNEWLRFEEHVHFVRELEETSPENKPGETACPSITHFRIYDSNGVLIADDNDVYLGDGYPDGHAKEDKTLLEFYANGDYLWRGGNHNSFFMGQNGPASALGYEGRAADYACLEIRDDTWCGPVDSGPTTPGQASNPNPSNSAADISVDADLSWTAGFAATSHDVYFGTDSSPDSGELQGNQTATTFDPNTMSNNTTYYWRIDEVNANGTTQGTVWSFTTEDPGALPGTASNPSPADSAASVSISADLSWTAGSGSTSSDVYFGTDSTPDSGEFQGNQTDTTFDPGTLTNATTYYWRIDEINASGTTTGAIWSFTTVGTPTGEVGIIGSWTQGTTHTEEAGSNRALIFIAHCDSYVTVPDLGSVTYGGQSMTKVVERVYNISSPTHNVYVCAFILDEDGIDAATSSTFSPTWNQTPGETPTFRELTAQVDLRPPRPRLRQFQIIMVIWL
ncbi:MAG: fibronectin type III domain-containing protein [Planctomycetota bacterium]